MLVVGVVVIKPVGNAKLVFENGIQLMHWATYCWLFVLRMHAGVPVFPYWVIMLFV